MFITCFHSSLSIKSVPGVEPSAIGGRRIDTYWIFMYVCIHRCVVPLSKNKTHTDTQTKKKRKNRRKRKIIIKWNGFSRWFYGAILNWLYILHSSVCIWNIQIRTIIRYIFTLFSISFVRNFINFVFMIPQWVIIYHIDTYLKFA